VKLLKSSSSHGSPGEPDPTLLLNDNFSAVSTMLLTSTARSVSAAYGLGRRAASTIATKYSKALFGAALAKSPQTLTKVHNELTILSNAIQKDSEISSFVHNPTLSLKERDKGLQFIFAKIEGAGAKKEVLSDITKNLFSVLSDNGRLGETEGVIEGFNELVSQHKGELTVTVTSATPLPRDILTRLDSTLKQSQTAKAAKTLTITNKVCLLEFFTLSLSQRISSFSGQSLRSRRSYS